MSKEFFYVLELPMTQVYHFHSTKKFTTADQVIEEVQRLEEEGEIDPEYDNANCCADCFCDNEKLV
jgi:hypothetical protein